MGIARGRRHQHDCVLADCSSHCVDVCSSIALSSGPHKTDVEVRACFIKRRMRRLTHHQLWLMYAPCGLHVISRSLDGHQQGL
eukprot:scaffold873_cov393-Prasinococcus_capsulatus_cf.AAC.27